MSAAVSRNDLPLRSAVDRVTDPADPRLRAFDCRRDAELRRQGRFLAEGPLVVRAALDGPHAVEAVLVAERKADAFADAPCPVLVADEAVMRAAAGYDFHRGVLAVGRATLSDDVPAGGDLYLALAGVEDAANVGSLIRLAAGFGCRAVLTGPGTHDPLYRRCVRVSMGHALRLPLVRADDLPAALARVGGRSVAATVGPDAVALADVRPGPGPTTLVVGGEFHGVPPDVAAACDVRATVPMAAGADSLNVAVAAGIFLHHLRGRAG